jgi:thiosulfate reductase cytochrome b subunit
MSSNKQRHSLAVRCQHWINVFALAIMVWSGLLIYWANDVYRIGMGRFTALKFFPEWFYTLFNIRFRLAEGMSWHFTFMWLFAANGLVYVMHAWIKGDWRTKFHAAQRTAYIGILLVSFSSILTGLAIYKPVQLAWMADVLGGYQSTRVAHFWLTIAYVVFFSVHMTQVVRSGWNHSRAIITGHE